MFNSSMSRFYISSAVNKTLISACWSWLDNLGVDESDVKVVVSGTKHFEEIIKVSWYAACSRRSPTFAMCWKLCFNNLSLLTAWSTRGQITKSRTTNSRTVQLPDTILNKHGVRELTGYPFFDLLHFRIKKYISELRTLWAALKHRVWMQHKSDACVVIVHKLYLACQQIIFIEVPHKLVSHVGINYVQNLTKSVIDNNVDLSRNQANKQKISASATLLLT